MARPSLFCERLCGWNSPYINHFIQPDSIIPEQSQGVQAWDRYAYTNNNPLLYNDPSGHNVNLPPCGWCGTTVSYASQSGPFVGNGFLNSVLDFGLVAVAPLFPGGLQIDPITDRVTFPTSENYYPAYVSNAVIIGADVVPSTPLLPAPTDFGNEGSIILSQDDLLKFGDQWKANKGEAYVISRSDAVALQYAPDRSEISRRLGVDLGNDSPLMRVDIDDLSQYDVHIPTGQGGNDHFILGGSTSGGLLERGIKPFNLWKEKIKEIFFK